MKLGQTPKIRKDGSTTGLMSRDPRANLVAAGEAPSGELSGELTS